jgi:tRNA A64-2'-O-ribosylphosphate transferase
VQQPSCRRHLLQCRLLHRCRLLKTQVAALYPSLPLFPNLRCGVWYVRPPLGDTCYFKSTDGHNGNWSFSTVRLNLNLAEAAAASGGCLIVDATKRGKVCPCCSM